MPEGNGMNGKAMVSMCALSAALAAGAADHVRTIEGFVLSPEEGLLIGNGDLSASAYQNDKGIVLRLGKSDVWDRRIDFTDTQRPYTIKEYTDFVLGRKPFDPKAQKPDALSRWPYPCPKPTGEFTLRLPPDFGPPPRFTQTLTIERNAIDFHAEWPCGLVVDATAVIPPGENALVVKYNVSGVNERTRFAHAKDQAAVWATLERKADPDPREWINRFIADWRYDGMRRWAESGAAPLPQPTAWRTNGVGCIEQSFYPDKLFPEGFRYRMTLRATPALRMPYVGSRPGMKDAVIHFLPTERQTAGEIVVHVTTSRDRSLEAPKARAFAEYAAATEKDARAAFRTGLSFPDDPRSGRRGDRFLEDLWYMTLHARRSICRRGAISPGLFFPSSLGDISVWHGDWHANYNLASIYYGDFTANQIDVADCYVDAAAMFLPIGRKIARDYYGCRGAMIQLEGFPTVGEDDHHSTLTLGRMVYMTGWFAERHLEYWKYTRDDDWLRRKGYPFIKECALFYLDFLKKAPHPDLPTTATAGAYHAFPSVQNEYPFRTETAIADHLDANGVVNHVRGGLIAAIDASKALGVDEELREQWEDRLANLVRPARPKRKLNPEDAYKEHCFRSGEHYFSPYPRPWAPEKKDWKPSSSKPSDWYPGIMYKGIVGNIRDNRFVAERDFPAYREMLEKWAHPNGLVWAMAIQGYGRQGAWTESLGCMAPLQEMIMTSWDGAIRLFPRWIKDRDVAFTRWRAKGAFLVSATQRRGHVVKFEIESEKGLPCAVHGEWQVFDAAGGAVQTRRDEFGRITFDTMPGNVYHLKGISTAPQA